jgi:uncharacterized protein (TIGR00369 family)
MERPTPDQVNQFVADTYPASHAGGTRCIEVGEGMSLARWSFDGATLRPGGYISGPTMFALADSALWYATFSVIGLEAMAVTSEMSIRFLRPARNGDLLARATINSVASRRIVGTIEIWVEGAPDKPVAMAQGSYARP